MTFCEHFPLCFVNLVVTELTQFQLYAGYVELLGSCADAVLSEMMALALFVCRSGLIQRSLSYRSYVVSCIHA